jgi:RNA polymerase sigma-70 factor, ECF subfamily
MTTLPLTKIQHMAGGARTSVTSLLEQVRNGGRADLNRLIEAVYPELRSLARVHLRRERRDHILQPTALVNELYLRLASHRRHEWQSRAHFFGATASIMRRILVEHARALKRVKREHEGIQTDVDRLASPIGDPVSVLEVDAALDELSRLSSRQARIVELRCFAGLSVPEVAVVLGVHARSVDRDWAMARAWLRRRLGT